MQPVKNLRRSCPIKRKTALECTRRQGADGADNTPSSEVQTPTASGVSFRPEFAHAFFGLDGAVREAARTAEDVLSTSRHHVAALDKAARGLKSLSGANTVKTLTLPSRSAGALVRVAPNPNDPIARQQGIENALSMALYFIRQPGNSAANLWAATARTNRALTLLKHANELAGTHSAMGGEHA